MDDSHHARRLVFKNIAAEADVLPQRPFDPVALTPSRALAANPRGWIILAAVAISLAVSGAALWSALQPRASTGKINDLTASLSVDAAQISAMRGELAQIRAEPQHATIVAEPPVRSGPSHRHRRAPAPSAKLAEPAPAPQAAAASSTAQAPAGLSQ